MPFLNLKITTLMMEGFRNSFRLIISCLLICCCFFTSANKSYADSKVTLNDQKKEITRSLETLKDLDYQTWQIIVYPSSKESKNLILRIVGFPGFTDIPWTSIPGLPKFFITFAVVSL